MVKKKTTETRFMKQNCVYYVCGVKKKQWNHNFITHSHISAIRQQNHVFVCFVFLPQFRQWKHFHQKDNFIIKLKDTHIVSALAIIIVPIVTPLNIIIVFQKGRDMYCYIKGLCESKDTII